MAEKGSSFPCGGVLPKEETGAAKFIQENPLFDGRGCRVAIFDTGVDPGVAGLQVTSDGRPKIIDVVDCTGSGDVDTTEEKPINADTNTVVGLSGRTLTLGNWKVPTGKVRLGLKRAFEIFPGGLKRRIKEERKREFDEKHRKAATEAQRALGEWEASHKSPSEAERREKKDLEAVIEALSEANDQYDDPGPVWDCVVFHDGAKWRAVVDTESKGDLTRSAPMTNYRDERQYATVGGVTNTKDTAALLNYVLNIYEDGKKLCIACDAGSHGTHVAGIVAANFPDNPELNGVAPGAQIVGCKIGDSRLGSMETGTGLVRALNHAKDMGCDLINLSYGESYTYENTGRVIEMITEFVNRHGITFVASAGNNGPALSTIGAPGGTASAIISVGAYVSPPMMEVEYSLREKLDPTNYTWSSRGPCRDGYQGVTICAPGGAIAPVPTWTLQGKQLMNGTSMSSPNCCGGLALLVSALRHSGLQFTPHSLRRAIENTAAPVSFIEPQALGSGLLQVGAAFEYHRRNDGAPAALLRMGVSLPQRVVQGRACRGLYVREPRECEKVVQTLVMVTPEWHPDGDNRDQVGFELQVEIRCDAPWVHVPQFMVVNAQGKSFDLKVDPTKLPEGDHHAVVEGIDAANPGRGPLFTVPITVVRPLKIGNESDARLRLDARTYRPGSIDRHFVAVPEAATLAEVTFRTKAVEGNHMLVVHALQVVPCTPVSNRNPTELEEYIRIRPNHEVTRRVPVVGGLTLELCLCKWWASLGECTVDVEVTFHSISAAATPSLHLHAAPAPLAIHTPLRPEQLTVSGKLNKLRKFYRPTSASVKALSAERDLLPLGRQVSELELTYSFEQAEKDNVKVTLRARSLYDVLYDSPFESQLWMLFDANKQLMGVGDALHEYDATVPKGKYTVKLFVRHDARALLDKLKALEVTVDFSLAKELTAPVYTTLGAAITGGAKYTGGLSLKGARTVLHVAPPSDKAAGAKYGDFLVGTLQLHEHKQEIPLLCRVPQAEADEDEAKDKEEKTDEALMGEAVRDAKVKRLKELRDDAKKADAFALLAAELVKEHPEHLPLLNEIMLKHDVDGDKGEEAPKAGERCRKAVAAADAIISAVKVPALASHYGVKHDTADPAQKKVCKEMDKNRDALVDALLVKGARTAELLEAAPSGSLRAGVDGAGVLKEGRSALEELHAAWLQIQQWVVAKDQKLETQAKHAFVLSAHERRHGRPGAAMAELLRLAKTKEGAPNKKVVAEIRSVCQQMGWVHLDEYYEELTFKLFPSSFPLH